MLKKAIEISVLQFYRVISKNVYFILDWFWDESSNLKQKLFPYSRLNGHFSCYMKNKFFFMSSFQNEKACQLYILVHWITRVDAYKASSKGVLLSAVDNRSSIVETIVKATIMSSDASFCPTYSNKNEILFRIKNYSYFFLWRRADCSFHLLLNSSLIKLLYLNQISHQISLGHKCI
jgi:hypothetical protein